MGCATACDGAGGCAPQPDAGGTDAGMPDDDAGPPLPDADTVADAGGSLPVPDSGGCGCRVAGADSTPLSLLSLVLVLGAAVLRTRRRARKH